MNALAYCNMSHAANTALWLLQAEDNKDVYYGLRPAQEWL